jgi:valyl-tRNA synthetase
MSKQLGNSPDPLDLIAKYGADGMRVAMLMSTSAGNDVMFDEALCEQGRNFCNKIWNAYRLINMWEVDQTIAQPEASKQAIAWFDEVMMERIERINHDMDNYRISEAFTELYRLFWDDFSGWYLEMIKPAYQAPIDAQTIARTKHYVDMLLRLLHPFMPFVTEEIWQDLQTESDVCSVVIAQQPTAERSADEKILARFGLAQEVITAIRNVRKQKNIAQKEALALNYISDENYPAEYEAVIAKMGNLKEVNAVTEKDATAAAFIVKTTQYFVPMEGQIDKEAELKKLGDDLTYYEGFLASVMKKLSNERFVSSAPEKVVANERAKQADAEAKIAALKEQIAALQ